MHRTASVNETSTRYSVVEDEFEMFDPLELRLQSTNNKQGSSGYMRDAAPEPALWDPELLISGFSRADILATQANEAIDQSYKAYSHMLNEGVAREQARNILPLATYTQCYWKIDLHNLFHFLRLRLDPHAQKEIREFAEAIAGILQDWVPNAYQAFVDYRLEGCYLSKQELEIIRSKLKDVAWGPELNTLSKREQSEFLKKL